MLHLSTLLSGEWEKVPQYSETVRCNDEPLDDTYNKELDPDAENAIRCPSDVVKEGSKKRQTAGKRKRSHRNEFADLRL